MPRQVRSKSQEWVDLRKEWSEVSGSVWDGRGEYQSPSGSKLLDQIVAKHIPTWTEGLRQGRGDPLCMILDEEEAFWMAATEDGKSVAFQVPILVHDEISRHPELCPGFRAVK